MNSVWHETAEYVSAPRPRLQGEISTDVLIIEGGMAGILTAHRLKNAGVSCVVVEAKSVGGGVTGNTTAKITAQHGLIYADLIRRFGVEAAQIYHDANTRAIKAFRSLDDTYPCGFEEKTAYVYTTNDRAKIEREADAYRAMGLHAKVHDNLPLPTPVAGAIAMDNQAQFHPLKLLYALAAEVDVYENTLVHRVKENTAFVHGGRVTAKRLFFATHFPMFNISGLWTAPKKREIDVVSYA